MTTTAPGTAELLESCRERDIHLWVEDGKLRYDAPAGALTEELRAALVAHKPELIGRLTHPDAPEPSPAPKAPLAPEGATLPTGDPDNLAFWERVAIAVVDGGVSRQEAERMAAESVGYWLDDRTVVFDLADEFFGRNCVA